MKVAIRYYSRGGNTEKLAKAIEEELGVKAATTDEQLTEDVDILFLGSSVYAYGVDDHVKEFISGINVKVGKVVNFSTAALVKSTYRHISGLLKERKITLAKDEFYCRGAFGPMHKGRPDEDDKKAVAAFAKRIVNG